MDQNMDETAVSQLSYQEARTAVLRSCNLFYGKLLIFEWLAVAAVAYFVSPQTWAGDQPVIHPHLRLGIILGFLVAAIPGVVAIRSAEKVWASHLVAVSQMLQMGLLVHITHGRIESHFGYFTALALLGGYRDWRVLVSSSAIAALDHVIRGVWLPASIFGSTVVDFPRIVEHAWWVVWEDIFLIIACVKADKELRFVSGQSRILKVAVDTSGEGAAFLVKAADGLNRLGQELDQSTQMVSKDTRESLSRAQTIATRMSAISASIDAMRASANQISGTLEEAANLATQSAECTLAANADVAQLLESSKKIDRVIETVRGLAWQTNLLSVNASIEAARAGDAGRGFAVVAEEVRALAKASQQSTADILQDASVVQEQTHVVAGKLAELGAFMEQLSRRNILIAEATHSQLAAANVVDENSIAASSDVGNIVSCIENLTHSAEITAGASQRTNESAGEIKRLADHMAESLKIAF